MNLSSSISSPFGKFERQTSCLPVVGKDKAIRLQVKMQQQNKSPSGLATKRQAIQMVPVSEVLTKTKLRQRKEHPLSEKELKVLGSDENFSWANDNYNIWLRTIDVWFFVISLRTRILFDNAKWTYLGGFSEDEQKKRRKRTGSWLREQVLQLGPTFIKIGQLFSTRSDLFPREFVNELAKLQDRVPAFSPEKARRFIESELGAPIEELFKEFDDQPIAAASLGQVHRAILHNGEKAVVKVQRPGLQKLFDIDFRNLKLIAEYFQRNETFGTRDWIGIYKECEKIVYEELDYINEGKNADWFRRDFRNVKWVRVPMVFWDYTATKVLTLEYIPGIKINELDALDSRGFNRSRISSLAIQAYLIQILKNGFFHADPHPGNLAIDDNEALIYYDFGMMGEIKSLTRDKLVQLFYRVYEKDTRKVIHSLIDLGVLEPKGDMSSVRRSVQFVLDNLMNQKPDQETTVAAIGEDLFAIAQDQPVRLPSTLIFVLKAFSTLEGIGYMLDPDFSIARIAAPYAQELLDIRQEQQTGTDFVDQIRKQANDARFYTMSMPYRIQRIEEIVEQLESGDLKLHVRVPESERAARKARILQMAAMFTVLGGSLLNLGAILSIEGCQLIAEVSFIGAGVFMTLVLMSMQRVKGLDQFEKMLG
ncbi:protein ACTIVITY OF BC1 COMPLEX KINASE 7, chloroplastic-like [Durio zibethinus]|uniref:Protein ACTIVITY OF BC1 COMPLEX KINASE 7, chloroplastic-like n=1 Tax=Durio zibethinus TaxID=66656 RepID=A0A6P6B3N4_DURZI|nr:protein ACTIVITY OF BC1 COMPLEX KINASE 7, chloroplastic-like [Durio zibethinus]XP_022771660.1 protein ACTIVITY OF BC1 COMPLEX KINASE 7, chloroplastic-like [Durio zibethinus]